MCGGVEFWGRGRGGEPGGKVQHAVWLRKGLLPWSGSYQQGGTRKALRGRGLGFSPLLPSGVYILIGAGALMMLVGFLGCCGAVQESQCMLGLVSIPSVLPVASLSYP